MILLMFTSVLFQAFLDTSHKMDFPLVLYHYAGRLYGAVPSWAAPGTLRGSGVVVEGVVH